MQRQALLNKQKHQLKPQTIYSSNKLCFLYKPFLPLPNLAESIQQIIEVKVNKCYLTKFNKAVEKRNFYGNEIYTSDSDVVCIL